MSVASPVAPGSLGAGPAVPTMARRAGLGGARARAIGLGAAGIAAAIALWAVLSAGNVLDANTVPGPQVVGSKVIELLGDSDFWSALRDTLGTWLASMAISIVVAVPLGLVIGNVRWLERPVGLVVDAARSVPSTALIPVAILVWGLGSEMKSALVIYAVFWPLLLNATYGAQGIDPMMKTVARSLRWGTFTTLRRVVLPGAAPAIATGIRVGAAVGLIVVLSAELLGATSGVGTLILRYQDVNQPDMVYAAIVLVGVLGLLVASGLSWLEKLLLPWSTASRSQR